MSALHQVLLLAADSSSNGNGTVPTGAGLSAAVKTFAGNIFLAVLAVMSLALLFRKQFAYCLEFLAVAMLVGSMIYTPQMWIGIAKGIGGLMTQ